VNPSLPVAHVSPFLPLPFSQRSKPKLKVPRTNPHKIQSRKEIKRDPKTVPCNAPTKNPNSALPKRFPFPSYFASNASIHISPSPGFCLKTDVM
jgi:hypothetical protein